LDAAGGNTATVNGTLIPASGVTLVSTAATQTLTNKSIAASQLTGALPAIDGSALTGISTVSTTLLGTIAVAGATTGTLSGLNLTAYKQIHFVASGLAHAYGNIVFLNLNGHMALFAGSNTATNQYGGGIIYLDTGNFWSAGAINTTTIISPPTYGYYYGGGGNSGVTNSSTSISFSANVGIIWSAGSIKIYGVK
jgi:hypothetical protein